MGCGIQLLTLMYIVNLTVNLFLSYYFSSDLAAWLDLPTFNTSTAHRDNPQLNI